MVGQKSLIVHTVGLKKRLEIKRNVNKKERASVDAPKNFEL